jgi:hypothetical protein
MGPGTGVAATGAMVCCAEAPSVPAAAKMAATQTLRMRTVVMAFPPCAFPGNSSQLFLSLQWIQIAVIRALPISSE